MIFPSNDSATEQLRRHTIEDVQSQGGNARIAMFDTVATFPEVRLPLERPAKACRDLGVLSLIDGAHGIGHIDFSHLASIQLDFFTSNCYK